MPVLGIKLRALVGWAFRPPLSPLLDPDDSFHVLRSERRDGGGLVEPNVGIERCGRMKSTCGPAAAAKPIAIASRCCPAGTATRSNSAINPGTPNPIFDLLREFNVSPCLADHIWRRRPGWPGQTMSMCGGHGPDDRYRDNYPDATLRKWARDVRKWRREGRSVYVYFDNDQ